MTPSYSSGNISSSPRRLIDTTAAGADPPSMTPSAFMCRSGPDRGSCTHATPMPLVTSFLHTHAQNTGTLLLVGTHGSLHQVVGTVLAQVAEMKASRQQFAGQHFPSSCLTAPEYPSILTTFGPCQPQLEERLISSSSRAASADGRTCSLSPPRNLYLKERPTF